MKYKFQRMKMKICGKVLSWQENQLSEKNQSWFEQIPHHHQYLSRYILSLTIILPIVPEAINLARFSFSSKRLTWLQPILRGCSKGLYTSTKGCIDPFCLQYNRWVDFIPISVTVTIVTVLFLQLSFLIFLSFSFLSVCHIKRFNYLNKW